MVKKKIVLKQRNFKHSFARTILKGIFTLFFSSECFEFNVYILEKILLLKEYKDFKLVKQGG